MHQPKPLEFGAFQGPDDPICELASKTQSYQLDYLTRYLKGLRAKKFLLEPNYFDLDYLDEFSSFYSLSSKGYPNICRRVHYFSDDSVDRALFERALTGDEDALNTMQGSYLGFSVLRPIGSPIGRTVLRWYKDKTPNQERITEPSRRYDCHIAGISLYVHGLAWQQQDAAVASCATVGVWSLLHSSAFDYRHSIPTTTQITLAANNAVKMGLSAFPSAGLRIEQLLEAIKHQRLNPVKVDGDIPENDRMYFSKEKFASTCAAFIRSGYPVLLTGCYPDGDTGHVVCVTGFRSNSAMPSSNESVTFIDEQVLHVYLHDDNYGPNIRFKIDSSSEIKVNGSRACLLVSEAPPYVDASERFSPPIEFIPYSAIVATHQELRLSSDKFHSEGAEVVRNVHQMLDHYSIQKGPANAQRGRLSRLAFSCRFMLLKDYLARELPDQIGDNHLLSSVRLSLQEGVPPMSLHIGILRIAHRSGSVLMDFIYDTTEASLSRGPYCHIAYQPIIAGIAAGSRGFPGLPPHTKIKGY